MWQWQHSQPAGCTLSTEPDQSFYAAGLVGITSACAVVEHYAAVVIGVIAGLIMIFTSKLLRRIQIDDPLDSIAVHFACGIW